MRAHFALPENDQDVEWFDDPHIDPEFVEKIFNVLKLGNYEPHRNKNKKTP